PQAPVGGHAAEAQLAEGGAHLRPGALEADRVRNAVEAALRRLLRLGGRGQAAQHVGRGGAVVEVIALGRRAHDVVVEDVGLRLARGRACAGWGGWSAGGGAACREGSGCRWGCFFCRGRRGWGGGVWRCGGSAPGRWSRSPNRECRTAAPDRRWTPARSRG